ncbi:MAG TPA: dUTP diphosphatase [Acidimicrobiales bacterium]|nr:dUTP diphosphatase [Acidimicrobiales bacterium]
MLNIPFTALDAAAAAPAYAHQRDAGADLVATCDVTLEARGGRALVPTGFAIAIPERHAGLVLARSGLAIHHGVSCLNAPGLIDSGFRGEVQVVLFNTDPRESYTVHRGDRVAQLVIVPIEVARFFAVEELPPSERGQGGFGHSGP